MRTYFETYRKHLIYYNDDLTINPDEFHIQRPFPNQNMSHGFIESSGSKNIKFIWSDREFDDEENNKIIDYVLYDLKNFHPKIESYVCYDDKDKKILDFPTNIIIPYFKDEIFELEYSFKDYQYEVDGKIVDYETYHAREMRVNKYLEVL